MSIAMRGTDSAQVAAAAAEYLSGGQTRRDGKETWIIDDCLGRMWAVIGGTDDIDAMFKQRIGRCVLISPLLAYEDMDDLLCLMREVCLATGVEGGPSCGIRVFADLGEGNPRAEANLRDLVFGKQALLDKGLETDVEAFRPRIEGRVRHIASGGEGTCEVFYGDAASSLDPRRGEGRKPKASQREGCTPRKRTVHVQVLDAQDGARWGRVQVHAKAIPEAAPG